MTHSIAEHGFTIVENGLSQAGVQNLAEALGSIAGAGKRGLLDVTQVAEVARSEEMLGLVRPYTGELAKAVRAIYFDKSAGANWLVAWHQDVTVAVEERVDMTG